jgi:hypothetical protein
VLNKNNARFAVFHDKLKAADIKIHDSGCSFYQIHDPSASSTNWYYFENLEDAVKKAKELADKHHMSYRDCKVCRPRS